MLTLICVGVATLLLTVAALALWIADAGEAAGIVKGGQR